MTDAKFNFQKKLSEEKKKEIFQKLGSKLGSENISDKEIDRIAYSKDYWPITLRWILEGKTPALPDLIVWPENREQVSEIIKTVNYGEIAITPFGKGSGVLDGAIPINGGIVIDQKNKIEHMELEEEYVFHDSCVLSRKLNIYDEPREVLNNILKLNIKEPCFNKKRYQMLWTWRGDGDNQPGAFPENCEKQIL